MATMLKQLYLNRETYGTNKGQITGVVSFEGDYGEVKLKLDSEVGAKIVAICAESVIAAAQMTSKLMIDEVLSEQTLRIEG